MEASEATTYSLQTALELKFHLRFGICGQNCICNHVCLGCLGLLWNFQRRLRKKERKMNLPILNLSASPQVKSVNFLPNSARSWKIYRVGENSTRREVGNPTCVPPFGCEGGSDSAGTSVVSGGASTSLTVVSSLWIWQSEVIAIPHNHSAHFGI